MSRWFLHKKTLVFFLLLVLASLSLLADFGPPSDVSFSSVPQSTASSQKETPDFWLDQMPGKILSLSLFLGVSVGLLFWGKKSRYFSLIRKTILVASVIVNGFLWGGYLCPTSAVQNIFFKWDTAYLILFSLPIVVTLFMGRLFCGNVCPVGALSELLFVSKWKRNIPPKLEKALSWVKYGVLAFLAVRLLFDSHVLDDLSPFKALFTFDAWGFNWILTLAFLGLSVVTYRPFCRFFCPFGALFALVSFVRPMRFRAGAGCVNCRLCKRSCPSNAIREDMSVSPECILCGSCCHTCPKDQWSYSMQKKTKKTLQEV